VSALLFNDRAAAERTLAALDAATGVVSAHIYSSDGRLFAGYSRRGAATAPPSAPQIPPGQVEMSTVGAGSAALARTIVVDGSAAGTVYIRSNLDALYERIEQYALIAAGVFAVAAVAALLVSGLARRTVARPIDDIARLARRVSEERDYALRASTDTGTTELATLASSFNDMLSQIQHRDQSLEEARATLERRVQERTADLDAANKELEAFSYSVSHDLRAPLRHVTGFANLLTTHAGSGLDDQGRRYLKTITDAAARMGTLIDDLLAFSRMGRASLTKRRVDLSALVRRAQEEASADLNGRRVAWTIGALPEVDADPALIMPALVNLLSNALKYSSTRDEARIEVGTIPSDRKEVVVFVRDNGVGFDMKYADKLFGVFQRLHRSEDFSGTGIGLANVRRIVQRHGGRTWAEGQVDRGATFYFSLPVADAAAERTEA
jgi:signal transduction histidine kinase